MKGGRGIVQIRFGSGFSICESSIGIGCLTFVRVPGSVRKLKLDMFVFRKLLCLFVYSITSPSHDRQVFLI